MKVSGILARGEEESEQVAGVCCDTRMVWYCRYCWYGTAGINTDYFGTDKHRGDRRHMQERNDCSKGETSGC